MHEDADNLAGGALLRCVDGSRDGFVILLGELHHQLPDAPPPPDEPPPPEKPPPKPPPPIPPPQPDPHVGAPYGMIIVRPPRLTAPREVARSPWQSRCLRSWSNVRHGTGGNRRL